MIPILVLYSSCLPDGSLQLSYHTSLSVLNGYMGVLNEENDVCRVYGCKNEFITNVTTVSAWVERGSPMPTPLFPTSAAKKC
jgi:hypothetical protein